MGLLRRRMHESLHEWKQRESLPLPERSFQASTVDFSCWSKNWAPNAYSWICSAHFASGEKSNDPLSPGYVPTLFAHTGSPVKRKAVGDLSRYRRSQAADLLGEDILKLEDELQLLSSENCRLKNPSECLTEASFLENNAKVKFHTGLPSFTTLMAVFACVSDHVITAPQASLSGLIYSTLRSMVAASCPCMPRRRASLLWRFFDGALTTVLPWQNPDGTTMVLAGCRPNNALGEPELAYCLSDGHLLGGAFVLQLQPRYLCVRESASVSS